MPETTVEVNSSPEPFRYSCGTADLTWAFGTPMRELICGHPHDQHGHPLRALAAFITRNLTDIGIYNPDFTLSQVLQDVDEIPSSYEHSADDIIDWDVKAARTTISDSAVLIRISMRRDPSDTETDNESTECRLALRLRMTSGPASTLEGNVFSTVCSGLTCSQALNDAIDEGNIDEMKRMLDLNEATVSCIIDRYPWKASEIH